MAKKPRIGSYLNLEKVRVSEDPRTNTIHITSKDPDIPGGFHLSLNTGTQTEKKLRNLLSENLPENKPRILARTVPAYASHYHTQKSSASFIDILRGIDEEPDTLDEGNPMSLPLGIVRTPLGRISTNKGEVPDFSGVKGFGSPGVVQKKNAYTSGDKEKVDYAFYQDTEVHWNIEDVPNLFTLHDRVLSLVVNHVKYWSNDWDYIVKYRQFSNVSHSKGLTSFAPGTNLTKEGRSEILEAIKIEAAERAQKLKELGVSSFAELDSFEDHKMKRLMVVGSAKLWGSMDTSFGADAEDFFGSQENMELALEHFERLGIHFALNVAPSIDTIQGNPDTPRPMARSNQKSMMFTGNIVESIFGHDNKFMYALQEFVSSSDMTYMRDIEFYAV